MRIKLLLIYAYLSLFTYVFSQENTYHVINQLDWNKLIISSTITISFKDAGLRLPSARIEAESLAKENYPKILQETLPLIRVNNRDRLDYILQNSIINIDGITEIVLKNRLVDSSLSRDLSFYRANFEFPLQEIITLLLKAKSFTKLNVPLKISPTKNYSGLIIYANIKMPVHGEAVEDFFQASLFPRVYDNDMNIFVSSENVSPDVQRERGIVLFSSSIGKIEYERVGTNPLKVIALSIFGSNRNELIIAKDDALRILSLKSNHEIINQGKIVIVIKKTLEDLVSR